MEVVKVTQETPKKRKHHSYKKENLQKSKFSFLKEMDFWDTLKNQGYCIILKFLEKIYLGDLNEKRKS